MIWLSVNFDFFMQNFPFRENSTSDHLQFQGGLPLDDFPFVICNSNLEYTLGKINGHGSSMHFGLISSKTDPRPHEHRWRPLGARKAGESIPSVNRMLRLSAHRR
ncbi:hypothetical protein [Denitratisoma sp. DHT3]|uniref:hypothetical protein n=1 Tax=Denitratisoma sp. DHT3 TaxID=1981880 RepID=UPI001648C962|nr:hypothetical protein [Denitratisoma sp. DHT3]